MLALCCRLTVLFMHPDRSELMLLIIWGLFTVKQAKEPINYGLLNDTGYWFHKKCNPFGVA